MSQANSTYQDNREQNVPHFQSTTGRNIKKPEVDQSMLGINSYHSPNTGGKSFDYQEKYADEPFGEELKDNSRVFKVYLDEAEIFDDDMIRGFRETIDSLLVFAALFSGVVTSFVIATISALQPDYSQITAVLLVEQVQILRAAGNATAINAISKSTVDLQNVSVATDDLWINGLFLASLSLALATALLSVLVKQWLQAYSSILAGSAKQKALIRQFRCAGFEKWKVPEIVGILPLILHTSLALFLIGLSLYISELHSSLSWIVVTVTILAFAFYVGSLLIPQVWLECPYRIPLLFVPAEYIIYPSKVLLWLFKWIIAKFQDIIPAWKGKKPSSDHIPNSKKKNGFPSLQQASLRSTEHDYLGNNEKKEPIVADILVWLFSLESNQSIQEILAQPIGAFLMDENWEILYSKLQHHADRAAKAIWVTLSKLQELDFKKLNNQVLSILEAFSQPKEYLLDLGTTRYWDHFKRGTVDYWDHLVSNNESKTISKYFEYSNPHSVWRIDVEKFGINKEWKNNALLEAVSNNDLEMIKVLVNNKANVNAQGGQFGNALQAAARQGNLEIAKFLLENKADVNAQGGNLGNALQAAALRGNLETAKLLLENEADVNAQGGHFGNALQAAAYQGNLEISKFLLENKADVNAQGGEFGNALEAAAIQGNLEIAKFLVENKADVNAQGGVFENALLAAAYQGYLGIAEFLLENKADVNAQEGVLGTALQIAAYRGNLEIAKFLVENKADVNAQGGQFGNALQAAASQGNLDIIKFLVENEADVNAQGTFGSALDTAASHGNLDIVKFLVEEKNVDVNAPQGIHETPLQAAAYYGHLHIVKYLAGHSAIVMTQELFANALQAAERGEHENVVKFLRSIQPDLQK
ncbi:hypothetical protein HHX47_DHR8000431 [Lentinula edodes]|nr:hypothetical protein HHX47_DHR8000431 [Lentinula edodes]